MDGGVMLSEMMCYREITGRKNDQQAKEERGYRS